MIERNIGHNKAGFTLLELMVIIVIIGIASTMAIVSMDFGGSMKTKREAERLVSLIQLAIDESIITDSEMGLELTEDGYRFLRLEDDEHGAKNWQVLETDGVLRPRNVHWIVISIRMDDDSPIRMPTPIEGNDAPWPRIVFLSSGEITPFQLLISHEDGIDEYRILGSWDGSVVLESLIRDYL